MYRTRSHQLFRSYSLTTVSNRQSEVTIFQQRYKSRQEAEIETDNK